MTLAIQQLVVVAAKAVVFVAPVVVVPGMAYWIFARSQKDTSQAVAMGRSE